MPHDRPDPRRLDLRAYPLCLEALTQLSDLARDMHVSNVKLAGFYDDARGQLLQRLYTPEVRAAALRPLLAQARLDYRAEVPHPSTVRVGTAGGAVGRTSFTMLQAQFLGETCVGLCEATFVNFGPSGPEPVSPAHRELLAELGLRAPAAAQP